MLGMWGAVFWLAVITVSQIPNARTTLVQTLVLRSARTDGRTALVLGRVRGTRLVLGLVLLPARYSSLS